MYDAFVQIRITDFDMSKYVEIRTKTDNVILEIGDQGGGGKKYHRFGAQCIRVIQAIRKSAFYSRND